MSKEKQQTAVEWLISKMPINALVLIDEEVIVKSKQIEKQQIKDAYLDGDSNGGWMDDDQYYNKKYGK